MFLNTANINSLMHEFTVGKEAQYLHIFYILVRKTYGFRKLSGINPDGPP